MKAKTLLVALLAAAFASQAQAVTVYDNTNTPILAGIINGTTTAIYGDAVTLTQGGVLDALKLAVRNGPGSAGPLESLTIHVQIFDNTAPYTSGDLQTTKPIVADFSQHFTLANPLDPATYQYFDFTGLSSMNFNLPENIMITQFYTDVVGGTAVGMILVGPDQVGTGTPDSYYHDLGSDEGLVPTSDANAAYKVEVNPVPEPASLSVLALGALALFRRQRKS